MIIGDTELNAQEAITEFKPEPTWMETVKASYDNFTSVNLSHSRQDYYKKEMGDNAVEYSKQDPQNAELYNRISKYAYKDIERLEALYEQGNTKAINNYVQQNPFQADIFLSQDFLQYKELQQKNGFKPQSQITEDINARALRDYTESEDVLKRSDHWTAELVGTMGGALSDIKTIQTLPLGTFKTGASVLGTAARAMGEEMGIETLVQIGIAPEVYGFKKEIGLNTSIMTEASNALASIATAGMFRGVGSAAYDLTAPGLKALRIKDPKLADDYEATFKGSEVSQSNKDFLDDMHKAEFEDPLTMEVSNPSEKGMELNSAEPIPQTKPEILAQVKANKAKIKSINERIAKVKEASEVPIGGSEDEAKQAVKDLFKKPLDPDAKYKKMSKADIAEIERVQLEQEAMDAFGVTREEMERFNDDSLMMKVGVDEQGEAIHKSYKELMDEHDMTDAYLKKARDCNL